jgi:hypothetical protein
MSDPVAASDSQGVGILEYRGAEAPERILRRRWVRIGLFVISLLAAVSPFLSFAYHESPLSVVASWARTGHEGALALVGLPFFAGVVAAAWRLRLVFDGGPVSRAGRQIVHGLAAMFVSATFAFSLQSVAHDVSGRDFLQMLIAPGLIAVGIGVITWLGARGRKEETVTAAIYFAYAANAAMCLLIFADSGQAGWWVTLCAVGAMGVEMAIAIVEAACGR